MNDVGMDRYPDHHVSWMTFGELRSVLTRIEQQSRSDHEAREWFDTQPPEVFGEACAYMFMRMLTENDDTNGHSIHE